MKPNNPTNLAKWYACHLVVGRTGGKTLLTPWHSLNAFSAHSPIPTNFVVYSPPPDHPYNLDVKLCTWPFLLPYKLSIVTCGKPYLIRTYESFCRSSFTEKLIYKHVILPNLLNFAMGDQNMVSVGGISTFYWRGKYTILKSLLFVLQKSLYCFRSKAKRQGAPVKNWVIFNLKRQNLTSAPF